MAGKIKKAHYYVWYLGWKECRGIYGREHTEPIAKELIHTRSNEVLPKLTIEVSRKELKIVQLIESKKGKIERLKYPSVPAKDVTYAIQALSPDEDVVTCIYLGYNPQTGCVVHAHIYRCDSAETGQIFTDHLNSLIALPEHQRRIQKIEADLVAKGQVVPRPSYISESSFDDLSIMTPNSDDGMTFISRSDPSEPRDDTYMTDREHELEEREAEKSNIYDNLTAELKKKLGVKDKVPILLPPKDYDTIHRKAGNLANIDNRRSQNINIVGVHQSPRDEPLDALTGGSDEKSLGSNRSSKYSDDFEPSKRQDATRNSGGYRLQGSDDGQHRREHKDSTKSQNSHGSESDLHAFTPRWKLSHAHYVPPHEIPGGPLNATRPTSPGAGPYPRKESPIRAGRALSPSRATRAMSPSHRRSPPRASPSRGRSPTRGYVSSAAARAMSPPPELKGQSYFHGTQPLPNYLTSNRDVYGAHNSHQRGRQPPTGGMNPVYSSHSDMDPIYPGKKYTASTLGLVEKAGKAHANPRMGHKTRQDEGYKSLERGPQSKPNHYEGFRSMDRNRRYNEKQPNYSADANMYSQSPRDVHYGKLPPSDHLYGGASYRNGGADRTVASMPFLDRSEYGREDRMPYHPAPAESIAPDYSLSGLDYLP